MIKFIVLTIILYFGTYVLSQQNLYNYTDPSSAVIPYASDEVKIKFKDKQGKILTVNDIDFIDDYEERKHGLIYVFKDNNYAFFDTLGNQLTPFKYQFTKEDFRNHDRDPFYLLVNSNGKYGVINAAAQELIPCTHDEIAHSTLSTVAQTTDIFHGKMDDKEGFYGINGEIILPFEYDSLDDNFNVYDLINAKKNGKWGALNKAFEIVIPFEYDKKLAFNTTNLSATYERDKWNPKLSKAVKNGLYGYIDILGNQIIPHKFEDVDFISDSIFRYKRDGKWGIYNLNQNLKITENLFDQVDRQFYNGCIQFTNNNKSGLLNANGTVILEEQDYSFIENIRVYNNGKNTYYMIIKDPNANFEIGMMDSNGKIVIPPVYLLIENRDYGMVLVHKDDCCGYIEAATGSIVVPCTDEKICDAYYFDRLEEIRYEIDFQDSIFTNDTTFHQNSLVHEIIRKNAGVRNGPTIQYDEFGQYIQTVNYEHGKIKNTDQSEQPSIAFDPKLQIFSEVIVSVDESLLLVIPPNKKRGMFLYDLRNHKMINTIHPDSKTFYRASASNSIIVDSLLYMISPKEANYYEVLDLKSGKSSGHNIKDRILSIEFLERDQRRFHNAKMNSSGWITTAVFYSLDFEESILLDVYSKNVITNDTFEITAVKPKKTEEDFGEYLKYNIDFEFYPENQILITNEGSEFWYISKINGKKLKPLQTINSYTEENEHEDVLIPFDTFVLLSRLKFNDLGEENVEFFKLTYHDLNWEEVKVKNLNRIPDFPRSTDQQKHYNEFSKQATISDNSWGTYLYDEESNTLEYYDYGAGLTSAHYLFGKQELIGISENGSLCTKGLKDTVVLTTSNYQNSISYSHYENKNLFLFGFTLNLSTGIFDKNDLELDSARLSQTFDIDDQIKLETTLKLFNSTYRKNLDGNRMISEHIETNGNRMISFYNRNKSKYLDRHVFMRVFNDQDYLLYTPDRYYMGSKGIGNAIYFQQGIKQYPFEQFDLKYNRPDIVLDRLGYADTSLISAYHAAYQKRLKKMGFTEDMLEDNFNIPEIELENFERMPTITDSSSISIGMNLHDDLYPLDRINVWINDVAIYGTAGISLRELYLLDIDTIIHIDLAKGTNKIQLSVLNQAGAESYKETFNIECTSGKEKPDLYLITIGESIFQQTDFNLKYAAKDARDIVELFEENKYYSNVFTKILINDQVTNENILALRSFLEQAKINDEVMIFIAGHGVLDANLNYYFATYDMDFMNPAKRGLAYENLENLMDGIKPIKKTLLIDACHSGEIDKDEVELAEADIKEGDHIRFRVVGNAAKPKLGIQNTSELTKSLFTDLRKGTGSTVISSAGGMEFAMEGDNWNNGLFTYCFIEGIQSKAADLNSDGEIWLSEIRQYVSRQVYQLSGGMQQPTSRIENQTIDFRIW